MKPLPLQIFCWEGGDTAYVINERVYYKPFLIKYVAGAWWLERGHVERLIRAFKFRYPIKAACVYARISYADYEEFKKYHPEIEEIRERCSHILSMIALDTLFRDIRRLPYLALSVLKLLKHWERKDEEDEDFRQWQLAKES